MPTAKLNGIEICYEVLGPGDAPVCLLIHGLGTQMRTWNDGFVTALLARGFRVVRFDNRDIGLSSATPGSPPDIAAVAAALMAGGDFDAPYTLSDMAADTTALLDHLAVDSAHVVGASMGGMIAQTVAFQHPTRVSSLTSIMSNTGRLDIGQPEDAALAVLMAPAETEREAAIHQSVEGARAIAGPLFDETGARERAREAYDRSFRPAATAFQLAAVAASGDRTGELGSIACPTLVIHGRVDPLVPLAAGLATAEAIASSDLLVLAEMGHDMPMAYWPQIADAIQGVATRAKQDS